MLKRMSLLVVIATTAVYSLGATPQIRTFTFTGTVAAPLATTYWWCNVGQLYAGADVELLDANGRVQATTSVALKPVVTGSSASCQLLTRYIGTTGFSVTLNAYENTKWRVRVTPAVNFYYRGVLIRLRGSGYSQQLLTPTVWFQYQRNVDFGLVSVAIR